MDYFGRAKDKLDHLPWRGQLVAISWGKTQQLGAFKVTDGTIMQMGHAFFCWPIRHIKTGGQQWWESKDWDGETWGPWAVIPDPRHGTNLSRG